jgi:hypothetical protein
MKKFIVRTISLLFVASFSALILITFFAKKNEENIDFFYRRFTSLHYGGLIVGTSRAAQIIEAKLIHPEQYNFAFTIQHSPFDSTYVELIKKFHPVQKFNHQRKHLVCVDPWSIRTFHSNKYENKNQIFEPILKYPVFNPNLGYLFSFCKVEDVLLTSGLLSNSKLNDGGRLEVNIDSVHTLSFDDIKSEKIRKKMGDYKQKIEFRNGYMSEVRLQNLENIISYLERDGDVSLCRLPISKAMYDMEMEINPNFDIIMNSICLKHKIKYINLIGDSPNYRYTDGNHIWNGQSAKITYKILSLIK